MKKFLAMLLVLIMSLSIVSCSVLPEGLRNTIDNMLGKSKNNEGEHVHEFVYVDGLEPTCTIAGYANYACSCGEKKQEDLPAHHKWGEIVEASRFVYCTSNGCKAFQLPEGDNIYADDLTFNFTERHKAELTLKYEQVLAMVEASARYDETLHGYAEEGALKEEYDIVDALHTELYDLVLYAITHRQIAEIDYYCDMGNKELEDRYSEMMDYCTEIIATFYSLAQPFYDSCYREFFYYGMTDPEIKAYIFEANAVADEEYTSLVNRNNEIELDMLAISDPTVTNEILDLYAEFVANNNRIAEILGYSNYLEYAYKNVYSRDYTYQDVSVVVDYVKKYIAPEFVNVYKKWNSLSYTNEDVNDYYSQVDKSFFTNEKGNLTLNDYIDTLNFTSNPDKQISFSDEFNKLISNGNLFRGQYQGAFVTSLYALDLPIAYFGPGYDNAFTVAHEFGHYMNEIYNGDVENQSYDLLEMHSQGNELLYLNTLKRSLTMGGYKLVEVYTYVNMLYTIMAGLAVDTFEQAVYLNYYDGPNSDTIMADGKITSNEYDLLYASIIEDFGTKGYQDTNYWRYGMTITSPCYYVSYSMSALGVLQLPGVAKYQSKNAATEAYLKLFTYTDENPDMTTAEVLEYAGLYSFTDEEMYKAIAKFLKTIS